MPQAGLAFQRLVLYCLHQALQLAGTPANLDLAVVDDGDPRRVIAAILQPPQPLDDDRDGLLIADISNNSAHLISSENRFVVPPLGGRAGYKSIPHCQKLPPKGGTTNRAFHYLSASPP